MIALDACPEKSPKTRPTEAKAIVQLKAIQATLYRATQSEEITPAALAQVARAWSDLEERKRVLRMKPAPKPIDVSQKPAKPKPGPAFSERPDAPKI